MKVSIIIRALNEEIHLEKLLLGIFSQETDFEFEVILVDSGSTDQTIEIAKAFPVKFVHIKPEEFSFGYALNQGIHVASGEIMVFISAHCYPVNNQWVTELVRPFENKKVALVYGMQRGNSKNNYSEHQIFKKWFPEYSDFNQAHPFCNNANAAILKGLWEKKQYDEKITGLEDLHWSKYMVDFGYTIVYKAEAKIIHVHEETYKQIFNRYKREAIVYRSIFKETFSFFIFIRLVIMNVFSDYCHAVGDKVFFKNILNIPLFRLSQFWGTYKGYIHKNKISSELRQIFYYPVKRKNK